MNADHKLLGTDMIRRDHRLELDPAAFARIDREIADADRAIIAAALEAASAPAQPSAQHPAGLRGPKAIGFALALIVAMATMGCLDPLPAAYEPTVCDRAMAEGTTSGCKDLAVRR